MHTTQQLMNAIKGHAKVVVICDKITFNLSIHTSYLVERLAVQTDLITSATDIRRIYVADTELRHIAMHMVDCIERINGDAIITWNDILLKLQRLIDNQTTTQGE